MLFFPKPNQVVLLPNPKQVFLFNSQHHQKVTPRDLRKRQYVSKLVWERVDLSDTDLGD